MTGCVVRFAPSPTGRIHIGNARTAVLNWLLSRHHEGGVFLLRFDDTDQGRSRQEFADGIVEDLHWLGIIPDRVVKQSDRFSFYDAAVAHLKATGRLYPCYETPEDLDRKRKRQLARGLPPVYDRAAMALTPEERAEKEAMGLRPHWRFLLRRQEVFWEDGIRGEQRIDTSSLSDPVLVREDGTYLYTLPSVVDDQTLGVTDIIRGEDHVVNTAVQIEIFEALGASVPRFAHHSLLVGKDGQGLSKRLGSLSLEGLRKDGLEAMAVASMAALLGTSSALEVHASWASLLELGCDLTHISRAPARFDEEELKALNARLLHKVSFEDVRDRLEAIVSGLSLTPVPTPQTLETFWLAVRGNLVLFSEVAHWLQVIYGGTFLPQKGGCDFIREALETLPGGWTAETWALWTHALKERTGLKGKALFLPLRQILTGVDHGPEMAALLPLMSRAQVETRLRNAIREA